MMQDQKRIQEQDPVCSEPQASVEGGSLERMREDAFSFIASSQQSIDDSLAPFDHEKLVRSNRQQGGE